MSVVRAGLSALGLLAGVVLAASPAAAANIKHVIVVAMENRDAATIYAGASNTPYINGLIRHYAHAVAFFDELPTSIPSEPHYVYMEAGTSAFADHTFTNDDDPSAANSTASHAHLVAQLQTRRLTWMSYEESVSSATGACPIVSSGLYAAKHDPFVFFQDVAGSPPSTAAAVCRLHTRALSRLATDLAANKVADYVFVTPNLCNDMHGAASCVGDETAVGDLWLSKNLPAIIAWAKANSGVIFIAWDEPLTTRLAPFIAVGAGVKPGYASKLRFDHGSMLKSVERIFGLPYLPTVAAKKDLADLFRAGAYP